MFSWKIALSLLVAMLGSGKGNIYAQTMAVVEINNGYVICVDFSGNEWAFEDTCGDWFRGDLVSCVMYDNDTEEIYDDEILSANYDGYIEGSWGKDFEGNEIAYFDWE